MSTRAVYQFFSPATKDTVLFYKHHDGYPQGPGGALARIQSVLNLAQYVHLNTVRKVMLAIGGEELKDQNEADTSDQQHRYNVTLDYGSVSLVHYDWHEETKDHLVLTADGWKKRWMADV